MCFNILNGSKVTAV